MEHKFIISQSSNDPTLRMCERCGLTHKLVTERNEDQISMWQEVHEIDTKGEPANPPGLCNAGVSSEEAE